MGGHRVGISDEALAGLSPRTNPLRGRACGGVEYNWCSR
jgi:hypothetical protein